VPFWDENAKLELCIECSLLCLRVKKQVYVLRSDGMMGQRSRYRFSVGAMDDDEWYAFGGFCY
jgi:hypothetical protein